MASYSGSHITTVNADDTTYNTRGTLSLLADGGWLVTWESDSPHYGDVAQQRFDAQGHRVGGIVQVGTEIGSQPVGLSDGGWLSIDGAIEDNGITESLFLQRYDDDGNTVGAPTLINDAEVGVEIEWGRAAELAGGGAIVTWRHSADTDENDIHQQQFDANGDKVGSETTVSSEADRYQQNSQVTALRDGGWVATWFDGGIYQRAYDANGDALGAQQLVYKSRLYEMPSYYNAVATDDGGWLLAWSHYDEQKGSNEILQQRYDSNGEAVGARTATEIAVDAQNITVAPLADGGWAMTWIHQQGSRAELWLQAFDHSGEARGREMLVDGSAAWGNGPQIDALDDGRLAVVWVDNGTRHRGGTVIKQEIFSPVENHAPVAGDDRITTDEDQKMAIDVLANDHDADGDRLTIDNVTLVSGQADVTFDEDGRVTLKGFDRSLIDGERDKVVVRYDIYDGAEHDTAKLVVTVNGFTSPGDEIHGTARNDVMTGRGFWEQLFGEDGDDTIDGRGGPDRLYGGDGNDTLIGGKGDDTLAGGRGDDVLVGGGLDETDVFIFNRGGGNDTVFNLGNGKIDLSALHEFRDFDDFRNHVHQHGDSLVIDLVGNNSITLAHQNPDLLWDQNVVL